MDNKVKQRCSKIAILMEAVNVIIAELMMPLESRIAGETSDRHRQNIKKFKWDNNEKKFWPICFSRRNYVEKSARQ